MREIVIVGCGISSYAFLAGVKESGLKVKIKLFCPKNYDKNYHLNLKGISPKFLNRDNENSLGYFLKQCNIKSNTCKILSIHGMGGNAKIWGGSVGFYSKNDLKRNNFSEDDYLNYLDRLKKYIFLESNYKGISHKIQTLLGSYLGGKLEINYPKLFLNSNLCDRCNTKCIQGCSNNAIFYPDKIKFNSLNLDIEYIEHLVNRIDENFIYFNNQKIRYDTVILGAGVFNNFKLLSSLSSEKKANLYNTPAISFAFFYPKINKDKNFFGMGNATFFYNKIFYGNLYDGESLYLSSSNIFSKNFISDKIQKYIAKYMVAGLGFLDSDNSYSTIEYKGNYIKVDCKETDIYNKNYKLIKDDLKKFLKEIGSNILIYKKVNLGADIHYGGGIPSDLEVDKFNIKNTRIIVIGGSIFKYLSPVSPSLSFMIKSFEAGFNLKEYI